jgi:FkbM family methyltransferase
MKTIIYDIGANNGDDIPYYLMKADLVVAVEANPALAALMAQRFGEAIGAGRLVIEDRVIVAGDAPERVAFHVHKSNHVLSQFPQPAPSESANFDTVMLSPVRIADLFARHGAPHYVKIDVEHFDQFVLRELFQCGIQPAYISAESHDIEIFSLLVALGGYGAFKLVDGFSVQTRFKAHPIASREGRRLHSFPKHSAGPFGNDIPGPWMNRNTFSEVLLANRLGWKDIHASKVDAADDDYVPPLASALFRRGFGSLKVAVKASVKSLF